jgi:hypothetical protein
MTWLYNGNKIYEPPEDMFGFIYLITNLLDNRMYVGKKNLWVYYSKKIKGKTRRKRVKAESDWRDYWSSSNKLKADIVKLNNINFKREIICFCKTRVQLSYVEVREQIDRRVLESDTYYNEYIGCRIKKHASLNQNY